MSIYSSLKKGKIGEKNFKVPSRGLVIGRDIQCDLNLNDNCVSKKHAIILFYKGNYIIRDLNSKNGNFVSIVKGIVYI
ncbi:MAG: FHA domain-containing protein [Caldisericia bacterium]